MTVDSELSRLLSDARESLAAVDALDRSIGGLVDRVGALRYAEGTLVGFLHALAAVDPEAARLAAPRIEEFISEAIAARLMLD